MNYWKHIVIIVIGTVATVGVYTATYTTQPTPQPTPKTPAVTVPSPQYGKTQVVFSNRVGPDYLYPDPKLTPGVTNPEIGDGNIQDNICNLNWSTKSIRPPVSYTTPLKKQELANGYTYQGDVNPADYELDHFISLEIGGNPSDQRNLWPEPYTTQLNGQTMGAHQKDSVENLLHKEVCDHRITLLRAQQIIVQDWYKCFIESNGGKEETCI